MQRPAHPFKYFTIILLLFFFSGGVCLFGETAGSNYSKREASLYRDVFDQIIYYQGTQYLHLERLYGGIFNKEKRALDVNVFDEVPDSTFFTNRHSRKRFSEDELKQGPDSFTVPSGTFTIYKGKFEGITPGFFVRSEDGKKYLLKFDPMDYLELATGAEVVTSRFFHAIGYNVPSYKLVYIKKDQFEVAPDAEIYDDTGFQKKLTPERLEEFLLFVPETPDGSYRASASRLLEGEILGPMSLQGRRRNDPEDTILHKDRRAIRALQVFASWLNCYDLRESNSLDVVESQDGRNLIRHYLIDFNTSLGSRPGGPQPPEFGYEHLFDYREIFKAMMSLGLWKKPWQKRWDEAGREIKYPSVGFFDNRYFNPGQYRTQLPYFPFKDLTRADGFWAAKIIMSFTDDEIRAVVSTGNYSDNEARGYLANTLIGRRDLVARYWFKEANPLDDFELVSSNADNVELHFQDLSVRYKFEPEGTRAYRFDVIGKKEGKGTHVAQEEVTETHFKIPSEWLSQYDSVDLMIRSKRQGSNVLSSFIRVSIRKEDGKARLTGILRQD